MNRIDLQRLARLRVREARALLNAGHSPGAYYLAGYAIECALKACIAKSVKRYEFPDRRTVSESYTHDLTRLMKVAGLEAAHDAEVRANAQFALNWAVAKAWSEDARYSLVISGAEARDMYAAVTAKTNGVLPWLKKRW
jgi:HEPN domain-containing protein